MPTVPRYTYLVARTQVLVQKRLDDSLWRRALRLIRKISKTQGILPSPYTLQTDRIRTGVVRAKGGFGIVSDGEYQGNAVAIKHVGMGEEVTDKVFKVSIFGRPRRSLLFESLSAVVSRDNRLETLISSQYFTLARGFHRYRAT